MAKEKPGVMMYWNTFDVLEALLDGQAKTMLRAIRNYSQYGEVPDFGEDTILATLWLLIRPLMDADNERYEQKRTDSQYANYCRWAREKGETPLSRDRWTETIRSDADESGRFQNVPITNPVSIPDTVTDPQPESFTDAEPNPNPVHEGKRESDTDSHEGKREGAYAPVLVDMEPEEEQEREQMKRQAMAKLWERIQEDANGQV